MIYIDLLRPPSFALEQMKEVFFAGKHNPGLVWDRILESDMGLVAAGITFSGSFDLPGFCRFCRL